MSQSSVSMQNASYQSPIWIKVESFGTPTPGAQAPHTIFGTKPCPIEFHRIDGSEFAGHSRYSSRLGRNEFSNGRPRCPIS